MKAPKVSQGDGALKALPTKVEDMVRAALKTGLWDRVEAKPSPQKDGWWEVDAIRNDGTLVYTRMWCLMDGVGRGRFLVGHRFAIGRIRRFSSPGDFITWLAVG